MLRLLSADGVQPAQMRPWIAEDPGIRLLLILLLFFPIAGMISERGAAAIA